MNELSGYGELQIGDKTLPFKFGLNAYQLFCSYFEIELHQLPEKLKDPFALVVLAYFAHVSNERIGGRQTDVTIDWFIEAAGDTEGILEEIQRLIVKSKYWGVPLATIDTKKKS